VVFGAGINMEIQCEGNPDDKFFPLVEKCNGVFKDPSGTYRMPLYMIMIC